MLKKAFIPKKKKPNLKCLIRLIYLPHLLRPTQNTGGQENRNYELRVSFSNSRIC